MQELTLKMTRSLRTPERTLRASLRSRNAHGHATRAILCENLQEKCGGPRSGRRVCASPRSRNAHGVSGPSIPSPSRRIGAPWCPRGRRCGPALELWDPVNTEANHPRNGRPPNSTSLTYIYIYTYICAYTHIYSIQLYICVWFVAGQQKLRYYRNKFMLLGRVWKCLGPAFKPLGYDRLEPE